MQRRIQLGKKVKKCLFSIDANHHFEQKIVVLHSPKMKAIFRE